MNVIIVGAGDVGSYLSQSLSDRDFNVTVIEQNPTRAQEIDSTQNIKVIGKSGDAAAVLAEAGVQRCDFLLAMTNDDRVNLIICSIGKALGAKTTIGRVHDQTFVDSLHLNYQLHFGVDYMLNPEALSAVQLAKTIRNPGRVAVENFARGKIEVQQVRVTKSSPYIGRNLADIHLNSDVRVGYVEHQGQIDIAHAETTFAERDLVTLIGTPESLSSTSPKFNPEITALPIRVVLFGGTEVAIAMVRLLSNTHFKIRIFDQNEKTCHELARRFPHVTILHGDATSLRILEEEQIGGSDFFVACSKDDEDNIMTSLQAVQLGAKHVQTVINRPDYEHIMNNLKRVLGLELAVSPRIATVNTVLRYLTMSAYTELSTLPRKAGKIIELRISPRSAAINHKIRELPLPKGSIIVALLHKFQATIPKADDTILSGDHIVVITREENIASIVDLFI